MSEERQTDVRLVVLFRCFLISVRLVRSFSSFHAITDPSARSYTEEKGDNA